MLENDVILKILDLARWAPSGDNTQPWRFEIVGTDHLAVHGFDTREHVLYDFDGHPSHMAHGALLETIRIAATRFGLQAEWQARADQADTAPVYDVRFATAEISEDPLVSAIESRTVQRRPMSVKALTTQQRSALADAAGVGYTVQFFESFGERLRVARLLWNNAYLRLTCPEAFPVHRDIIEWNARFSEDRIPDQAVGVDPLTARLMRWVMVSWERVHFFNRFLMGTITPRIQLDFVPALACAAHVLIRPRGPLVTNEDYVRAGIALQRLWLTATHVGLHLQPEMTPLIFRWYARAGRRFSASDAIAAGTTRLAGEFEAIAGAPADAPFAFFCRVGNSSVPWSRSVRRSLAALLHVTQ